MTNLLNLTHATGLCRKGCRPERRVGTEATACAGRVRPNTPVAQSGSTHCREDQVPAVHRHRERPVMIVIQFDVESGTRMGHPYAQMPANVVSDLSPEWRRDLLPGDILRRIYSNGFHPFIVLRRADIHPAPVEICS